MINVKQLIKTFLGIWIRLVNRKWTVSICSVSLYKDIPFPLIQAILHIHNWGSYSHTVWCMKGYLPSISGSGGAHPSGPRKASCVWISVKAFNIVAEQKKINSMHTWLGEENKYCRRIERANWQNHRWSDIWREETLGEKSILINVVW